MVNFRNSVIPSWKLPLISAPVVHALGSATMGHHEIEIYHAGPHWQLGHFKGSTKVELSHGSNTWSLDIKNNDIFIIPPNSTRKYFSQKPLLSYYLEFSYPSETSTDNDSLLPAIISSGASSKSVICEFKNMIDCKETDPHESELLTRLWLWRLLKLSESSNTLKWDSHTKIPKCLQLIRENFSDPELSSESLARDCALSRRRLDQLFNREMGKTVSQCIRDRRIDRSKNLLQQTLLPIHIIGEQVGIPDRQVFNKFIKRYLGKSPTDLRNSKESFPSNTL
jgi:AraC-like DNA-binding protein